MIYLTKNHQYLNNGKIINAPSVTQIIERIHPFPISEIDPLHLKKSILKGNCVHYNISRWLKNGETLNKKCIHKINTHYEQYCWLTKTLSELFNELIGKGWRIKNVKSEESLYSKKYNFCGTIDFSFQLWNNEQKLLNFIVDFKTTSMLNTEKEYCQLKLYSLLWHENIKKADNDKSKTETLIINCNKKKVYDPQKYLNEFEKSENDKRLINEVMTINEWWSYKCQRKMNNLMNQKIN